MFLAIALGSLSANFIIHLMLHWHRFLWEFGSFNLFLWVACGALFNLIVVVRNSIDIEGFLTLVFHAEPFSGAHMLLAITTRL